MRAQTFNTNWRVKHLEEEDWLEVTLPDDAMLREPRTAEAMGGLNVSWFETIFTARPFRSALRKRQSTMSLNSKESTAKQK